MRSAVIATLVGFAHSSGAAEGEAVVIVRNVANHECAFGKTVASAGSLASSCDLEVTCGDTGEPAASLCDMRQELAAREQELVQLRALVQSRTGHLAALHFSHVEDAGGPVGPHMATSASGVAARWGIYQVNFVLACTDAEAFSANTVMRLTMGNNVDYFRPVEGKTFCEMVNSPNSHQWSADAVTWRTPVYTTGLAGGSAGDWPKTEVLGDGRVFLPTWGGTHPSPTGGCCHNTKYDAHNWQKTFDLHILPPAGT